MYIYANVIDTSQDGCCWAMRLYNGKSAFLVRHFRPWQLCGFKSWTLPTHYETLGVKRSASQKEIKTAYIKLSKQHHPDVSSHPNAQTQFMELSEAYQVLSNPKSKRTYDNKFIYNASVFTDPPGAQSHCLWQEQYARRGPRDYTQNRGNDFDEDFNIRRGINIEKDDVEEIVVSTYDVLHFVTCVMIMVTTVIVMVVQHRKSINNNLVLPLSLTRVEDINQNKKRIVNLNKKPVTPKERAKQLKYIKTKQQSEQMEVQLQ